MFSPRSAVVTACTLLACTTLVPTVQAQDDQLLERSKKAAKVLANLVSDPANSPPNKLLRSAVCMAVIPGVKEAAFVFGAKGGYGLASCRTAAGWSLPTYVGLKAGSVGFQVGGQETDVVLVFTHDDAPQLIAGENFQLGTKASIAAGPVGSTIGAGTDFKKGSAVYSYSTKGAGLFAGVSLDGSNFQIDDKGNRTAYPADGVPTKKDKSPDVNWLLKTHADAKNTPATVNPFVQALDQRIGKK